MVRDPRVDPKPGDVLIPAKEFRGALLVVQIIDVPGWYEIKYAQPFLEIRGINIEAWRHLFFDAEVIHVAD